MNRKTFLVGSAALIPGSFRGSALKRAQAKQGDAPVPAQGKTNLLYLRAQVETRLAQLEASLAGNEPAGPSTRNLPNGALASLYLGHDPKRAETLLRRLFVLQDIDEKSPHYGEVPWQAGRPEIIDRNAEVFSSQAIGPILLLFGDKLSPAFKTEARPHVKAFFAALQRRTFKTPAYTNIYLMRLVSTILMGEAIEDADMAAQGYAWLDEWLRYTAKAGIHEFNSPTYTAVDLNSLYLGYRFAKKPNPKPTFKAILDYFWTDLAANYFAGRGSYSGPHSRDYEFIGGWSGGVGYYYSAYGLRDDNTSGMLDLEKIYPLLNTDATPENYRPSPEILALARQKERLVQSRWDAADDFDRTNYITPQYAIGSTTGGYGGAQEKLITVELASFQKLPVINIVPDSFDAPYGLVKRADKSGHDKAVRLPFNPVSVQDKNVLLVLGNINPTKAPDSSPTISTSVLLPARADRIMLNGTVVNAGKPFRQNANIGDTVGVREGRAGVAIRLVGAGGLQNQTPAVYLQADAEGLSKGVLRFTVYHYHGEAKKQTEEQVPIVFLILADECEGDSGLAKLVARLQTADVSGRFNSDGSEDIAPSKLWVASAGVADARPLRIAYDPTRKTLLERSILRKKETDRRSIKPFGPLTVNGDDVFARILGPVLPPDTKYDPATAAKASTK